MKLRDSKIKEIVGFCEDVEALLDKLEKGNIVFGFLSNERFDLRRESNRLQKELQPKAKAKSLSDVT